MWGLSLSQGFRSQMLNRGGGTAGQVITHLEIDYSSSEVGDWGDKYLAVVFTDVTQMPPMCTWRAALHSSRKPSLTSPPC